MSRLSLVQVSQIVERELCPAIRVLGLGPRNSELGIRVIHLVRCDRLIGVVERLGYAGTWKRDPDLRS